MDDINLGLQPIPKGMSWTKEGGLQWSQHQLDMDEAQAQTMTDDRRTLDLIRQLADTITMGIKFTVDLPIDHEDGKSPMLDTAAWVQPGQPVPGHGDTIRYSYYEKPTTSPLVFHANGAHTWRTKITTLAQEGI